MHRLTPAAALVAWFLAAPVAAQRPVAKLASKKHEVAVEYGAVPVGKHGLHELPVGGDWRMGFNQASQIRLSVPLVAGDVVAAPGSYRIKILHEKQGELHLLIEGAGTAFGASPPNASFAGELTELKRPTKKLEIAWEKGDAKADSYETKLDVSFGEHRLVVPMSALRSEIEKGKAFTAEVFAWPAQTVIERIERGDPTPIATVRPKRKPKGDEIEGYNLVVAKTTAKLVPLMRAPTSSFGFGPVEPPDAAAIITGTIEWADVERADQGDDVRLTAESFDGGKTEVSMHFTCGTKRATVAFEIPEPAKKGG